MRKPIALCALFFVTLTVLAGCGDDDKSTAPGSSNLDSKLFGTWVDQSEDSEGFSFTFEEDGTLRTGVSGAIEVIGSWSVDGDQLSVELPGGSYDYVITDGQLEFTTKIFGGSDLDGFIFTGDEDASTLTGINWLDEDGCVLVFNANGTYRWGDAGSVFEEGSWSAEGSTVTVILKNTGRYTISGNSVTLFDEDGEGTVFTKN